MKPIILLLGMLGFIGCKNAARNQPVNTVDTLTTTAPTIDKAVADTNDHNVGVKSDIALDSPTGPKIKDTLHRH